MNSLIFTLYGAYISILDLAITYFFLCIYKNYVKISNNLLNKTRYKSEFWRNGDFSFLLNKKLNEQKDKL